MVELKNRFSVGLARQINEQFDQLLRVGQEKYRGGSNSDLLQSSQVSFDAVNGIWVLFTLPDCITFGLPCGSYSTLSPGSTRLQTDYTIQTNINDFKSTSIGFGVRFRTPSIDAKLLTLTYLLKQLHQ